MTTTSDTMRTQHEIALRSCEVARAFVAGRKRAEAELAAKGVTLNVGH